MSLWVNAMEFAWKVGDFPLLKALTEKFEAYLPGGAKNDRQHNLDMMRINGDPHGQAALLWVVNSLWGERSVVGVRKGVR